MNGIDEVARNDHRPLRLDGLHVLVAYAHGADASGQHEIVEVGSGGVLRVGTRHSGEHAGLSGRSETGVCTST